MRECGECYACCVALENDFEGEVGFTPKKAGEPCNKLDLNLNCNFCTVYHKRPKVCRTFNCSWLYGYGNDNDRPNESNMLVYMADNINNGNWIFGIELAKNALLTSGKEIMIDIINKNNTAGIILTYQSKRLTGDLTIVKNSLLSRASAMVGTLQGWLDNEESIGIYTLVNPGE